MFLSSSPVKIIRFHDVGYQKLPKILKLFNGKAVSTIQTGKRRYENDIA